MGLDVYGQGFREGYLTALGRAAEMADRRGVAALVNWSKMVLHPPRGEIGHVGVFPREGGHYTLYCYDCWEWVPDNANTEMRDFGAYAHSHSCFESRKKREGEA